MKDSSAKVTHFKIEGCETFGVWLVVPSKTEPASASTIAFLDVSGNKR
jgi:hypothetical protein